MLTHERWMMVMVMLTHERWMMVMVMLTYTDFDSL